MPPNPEQLAREQIDALLEAAGWLVTSVTQANIHGSRGVAIREFPLVDGLSFADYLLYVDGKAAGVIEAKKAGSTLIGVEIQSNRYAKGLPQTLPAWRRPLPFLYESTGVETRFTNGLDSHARSRSTFAFHRPETLASWFNAASATSVRSTALDPAPAIADAGAFPATFLSRLQGMSPLVEAGLWPPQIIAIKNLEKSLAATSRAR